MAPPPPPPSPTLHCLLPASFDYVRTLIRDEAGIVLEPGKEYLVEARLTPLARQARLADLEPATVETRG